MIQPTISPAQALWENRNLLRQRKEEVFAVRSALQYLTGGPRDFLRQQWFQIISMVLEFKPDLILELGRGYGNSTCAFSLAANFLQPKPCSIVSLCLADEWRRNIRPGMDSRVGSKLFSPLTALEGDIRSFDFSPHLAKAQRVLVFWDAHGWDVAESILAKIFTELASKEHLAIIHDMADLKYASPDGFAYGKRDYWLEFGVAPPKVILGDMGTQFDEGIVLADFSRRNEMPLRSAESSYFNELTEEQVAELKNLLGEAEVSRFGFWYFFSLAEARRQSLTFPPAPSLIAITEVSLSPPPPPPPPPVSRLRAQLERVKQALYPNRH